MPFLLILLGITLTLFICLTAFYSAKQQDHRADTILAMENEPLPDVIDVCKRGRGIYIRLDHHGIFIQGNPLIPWNAITSLTYERPGKRGTGPILFMLIGLNNRQTLKSTGALLYRLLDSDFGFGLKEQQPVSMARINVDQLRFQIQAKRFFCRAQGMSYPGSNPYDSYPGDVRLERPGQAPETGNG